MAAQNETPAHFTLPIMADFRRQADGSYTVRPVIPDGQGDTWVTVKEAGRLLDIRPQCVYPLLGDFLVYKCPLKARRLVSLQSILKYNEAVRNPAFWNDPKAQARLQSWVAQQMPNV